MVLERTFLAFSLVTRDRSRVMQVMLLRPSLFENFYRRPSIKILPCVLVNPRCHKPPLSKTFAFDRFIVGTRTKRIEI